MKNKFPSIKAILDWAHVKHFDRLDDCVIIRSENTFWYFAQLPTKAWNLVMKSSRNLSQEQ